VHSAPLVFDILFGFPFLLTLLLFLNLVFTIILRRASKQLGGSPPGFYMYQFIRYRYIYKQGNDAECRNLKTWIRLYVVFNVIAFTGIITLLT